MRGYQLTATHLRVMLTISMFVIVAIAAILAFFTYTELKKVAVEVNHISVDASASQNNIQTLQQIQEKLTTDKDVITRTNSIVAESQSYQYQDQILADLKDYAAKAEVTITNIDFTGSTAAPQTTPSTTTPSTPATPNGVKSTSVSITLKNPIIYENLLRFIQSIEQNLTKMQISKISLSRGTSGSEITSDALTIEVYIR